jgi:glycosyltransferase involved in cell wall biosynthesis
MSLTYRATCVRSPDYDRLHAMSDPCVSVVMAVRNGSTYLTEAVNSILLQTLRDFELVIVDDGSSDRTPEIIAAFASRDGRVRVVTEPPHGLVPALNRGCALARAPYIARMDADDIAAPSRLSAQLESLRDVSKIGVLGTAARVIDSSGSPVGTLAFPLTDSEIRALLEVQNAFVHPSVMFRREVFADVGGYRSVALDAEDYDLWLRMAEVTQLANLEEILLDYRVHPDNVTSSKLQQQVLTMIGARAAADSRRIDGHDPLDGFTVVDLDTLAKLGVSRASLQTAVENAYLARAGSEFRTGRRREALDLVSDARVLLDDAQVGRRRPRLDLNEARLEFAAGSYVCAGNLLARAVVGAPLTTLAMAARALRRSVRDSPRHAP